MSEATSERTDQTEQPPAAAYPSVWDGPRAKDDGEGGAEAMLDRMLDGDWSTS
jgi:hypothetical protein